MFDNHVGCVICHTQRVFWIVIWTVMQSVGYTKLLLTYFRVYYLRHLLCLPSPLLSLNIIIMVDVTNKIDLEITNLVQAYVVMSFTIQNKLVL